MNLVDFKVTEIIEEKYGKLYELFGMTLTDAEEKISNNETMKFLLDDGCCQKYKYESANGNGILNDCFNLRYNRPYQVGETFVNKH